MKSVVLVGVLIIGLFPLLARAAGTVEDAKPIGPALESPRELLDLLEQRRRAMDRREELVRASEERLGSLRAEMERLVERTEKARQVMEQADAESRKMNMAQLSKMYEAMPPEEAAARIERMPTRAAIDLLHHLKAKTAGNILSLVRPEIAARLTERYMAVPVRSQK
jgi:flagellar motility protein MotE (MotC chaperone)